MFRSIYRIALDYHTITIYDFAAKKGRFCLISELCKKDNDKKAQKYIDSDSFVL